MTDINSVIIKTAPSPKVLKPKATSPKKKKATSAAKMILKNVDKSGKRSGSWVIIAIASPIKHAITLSTFPLKELKWWLALVYLLSYWLILSVLLIPIMACLAEMDILSKETAWNGGSEKSPVSFTSPLELFASGSAGFVVFTQQEGKGDGSGFEILGSSSERRYRGKRRVRM